MAPPPRPGTLVLDDGELADVRRTLEELGVEYTYLRGGAVEGLSVAEPRHLLVASGRQALRLGGHGSGGSSGRVRPARVAVVREDSNTLRQQLRGRGFDYLVRQPVHASALKLLLLRALYRGPERRVAVRYPVGAPVHYRTGLRRRPATLMEVALRGCRLRAPRAEEVESRITVTLPKDLTRSAKLSLAGWVVRCEPADSEGPEHEVAVAFDRLAFGTESALRELLLDRIGGPEPLGAPEEGAADGGDESGGGEPSQERADGDTDERDAGAGEASRDRRDARRAAYRRQVLAIKNEAQRALVGRNLSTGGMLVEQNLSLREGDDVRLAIFGRPREEPIVVRARVVREDSEGMALQFFAVGLEEAERLEALVADLPSVERLADGEAEAMGTVMAQIVGSNRGAEAEAAETDGSESPEPDRPGSGS